MMRAALVLLVLAAGCTRKDPLYCDAETPCRPGLVCRLPERECVPAPDEGDLARPDQRVADLAQPPPDLSTGTECSDSTQCPAARPVCRQGRCGPCTRNYHCPRSACDDNGQCHDPARVLVVDDTMGACRRSGQSGNQPYCFLREALDDPELGRSRDVVLIRPSTRGGHRLEGNFLFVQDSIRLVGARTRREDPPVLVREPIWIQTTNKAIEVGIEDLHIGSLDSGSVRAIHCTRLPGAPPLGLTVRWSRIEGAPLSGIETGHCSPVRLVSNVVLRNATSPASPAAGVLVSGGEAMLLNNIIADNGMGNPLGGGVVLTNVVAGSRVAFNTVVNNRCAGPPSSHCNLRCDGPVPLPTSYSILAGSGAGRQSITGTCQVSNSVVPQGFMDGTDNLVGVEPVYVNAAGGDYHLRPDAMVNRMLRRPESNPAVTFDIDEDPRPPGGVDIGADQMIP
ncbi:MAG: right-handed parallel beta-helix repeat-containing protein [Myxococcales bacterium]|nr:right-handed parallel beta-helix repeat-containing protein [Myxococcota bacterium]MDW8283598.1 right-handed parallel beta-helix repeat-containing protein [Myxococcales bacterium]